MRSWVWYYFWFVSWSVVFNNQIAMENIASLSTNYPIYRYAALEDYENGEKCYQSALRVDVRHYNAWYGLGMIYFRKENFEFAEHHFQQALQLNPHSSVIMCYLGNTLHAQKVGSLPSWHSIFGDLQLLTVVFNFILYLTISLVIDWPLWCH